MQLIHAMKIPCGLEKLTKTRCFIAGFALLGAVGTLDLLSGYELSFSLFYILPISLITWFTGRRYGLLASIISAFIWYVADAAAEHQYSHPLIPVWNTLIRLAFFILISFLLSAIKRGTERERELAHTDFLTGAVNSRLFFNLIQMEVDRSLRHKSPFTLAYIDLDNFKKVNDQFGHTTGDEVLRAVVNHSRKHLRKTDVVARLGGDEFALLLPDTDQQSAQVILTKTQAHLLEEMQRNNWPITFSIGALTCTTAPQSTDELIRMADELMYSVKHESKNAIKYATYAG